MHESNIHIKSANGLSPFEALLLSLLKFRAKGARSCSQFFCMKIKRNICIAGPTSGIHFNEAFIIMMTKE